MVQKGWWDEQRRWAAWMYQRVLVWHKYTVCKSKLVLLLRLGYLSHFLAGPKRTRQGPGLRAGALFISRCWFRLTVVAGQNNTKDYKIILSCVLLLLNEMLMLCEWFLWNVYVIDRLMNWQLSVSCKEKVKIGFTLIHPPSQCLQGRRLESENTKGLFHES